MTEASIVWPGSAGPPARRRMLEDRRSVREAAPEKATFQPAPGSKTVPPYHGGMITASAALAVVIAAGPVVEQQRLDVALSPDTHTATVTSWLWIRGP